MEVNVMPWHLAYTLLGNCKESDARRLKEGGVN
jgi:hypothetical protein